MLDNGFERFCHLATQSRAVSTIIEANVIPPWNVAVSVLIQEKSEKQSPPGLLLRTYLQGYPTGSVGTQRLLRYLSTK